MDMSTFLVAYSLLCINILTSTWSDSNFRLALIQSTRCRSHRCALKMHEQHQIGPGYSLPENKHEIKTTTEWVKSKAETSLWAIEQGETFMHSQVHTNTHTRICEKRGSRDSQFMNGFTLHSTNLSSILTEFTLLQNFRNAHKSYVWGLPTPDKKK